jgi:hypothetical protein
MNEGRRVSGWTGWVFFAAALMIFEGILNFFYGLGALFNAHWFVYAHGSTYLINVSGWGWWMLVMGVLLGISGALLWTGNMFGRVMGIIFGVLSALVNIGYFSAAPIWSTIAIIVDVLVIYAIAAHGQEMKLVNG